MSSVIDDHCIAAFGSDRWISYEVVVETCQDGFPSGLPIDKNEHMGLRNVEFFEKELFHSICIQYATVQVVYLFRLVFIDTDYEGKDFTAMYIRGEVK